MAVQIEHDEDECQFVTHVSCKDLSSDREIENTFKDLETALNRIEEQLDNSDIYYFIVSINAKGARPGPGEFDPYDGEEYELSSRNPWEVFCPPFWTKACAAPHHRQRVKDWMTRLEKTLKRAEGISRSTASLWEHDETQFGEPLATHMALLDVEFVPYYTRLLRLWDLGHEVEARKAIVEIVDRHGICAETQELILSYAQWDPSDELGLVKRLRHS